MDRRRSEGGLDSGRLLGLNSTVAPELDPREPGCGAPEPASRRLVWGFTAVTVLFVLGAYLVALPGPFIFDDIIDLAAVEAMHGLWPPTWLNLSRRPLTTATFVLSWWVGGGQPWAFRLFNIGVHILAAGLVFTCARLVLRQPSVALPEPRALWVAGFTALAWAVHPLHTSAVTYIVHRYESLAGLCYLGAVAAFLAGAASERAWRLHALAVGACLLGGLSKEILVTAPLAIFMVDSVLLSPGPREALRRRWRVHLALWLALVPLVCVVLAHPVVGSQGVREGGVTRLQYLLSEPAVLAHYMRLIILPTGLSIDYYDWPIVHGIGEWTVVAWLVALGVGSTIVGLWRRSLWALAIGLALLVLVPSSSILPLNGELAAERRMYLPLVPLLLLAFVGLSRFTETIRIPPIATVGTGLLAVALLTWLSSEQNGRYLDSTDLLGYGVEVRPRNARARTWYAWALMNDGRLLEAAQELKAARALDPKVLRLDWMDANVADRLGRVQEAARFAAAWLQREGPDQEEAIAAATMLDRAGRTAEALLLRKQTVEHFPDFAPGHGSFAWQLATDPAHRDPARALLHASRAVALLGSAVTAREKDTLAAALAANGRFPEAIAIVRELAEGARAAGSPAGEARFRAEAEAYAVGRPWSREDDARLLNL